MTTLPELTAKRKPRTQVQGLSDKVLQELVLSPVAAVLLPFSKFQIYIE